MKARPVVEQPVLQQLNCLGNGTYRDHHQLKVLWLQAGLDTSRDEYAGLLDQLVAK
jgi:hypothetical protein